MPPIDFVHELLLPEAAIIVIALMALIYCLYAWFKCKEYAALSYVFAAAYHVVIYSVYFLNPALTDDWHRVLNRGGLVVLFVNIILQRWKFIRICREREAYEQRPTKPD